MQTEITTEQLGKVTAVVIETLRGVALPPQADAALQRELAGASPSHRQEIRDGVCEGLRMLFRDLGFWQPEVQNKIGAALSARGLPSIMEVSTCIGKYPSA